MLVHYVGIKLASERTNGQHEDDQYLSQASVHSYTRTASSPPVQFVDSRCCNTKAAMCVWRYSGVVNMMEYSLSCCAFELASIGNIGRVTQIATEVLEVPFACQYFIDHRIKVSPSTLCLLQPFGALSEPRISCGAFCGLPLCPDHTWHVHAVTCEPPSLGEAVLVLWLPLGVPPSEIL